MSKKRPHYLVDGYNLIHAWEELRGEELYIARDRLTNWLIEYGGYEKFDITLVFDAAFTDDEEKVEDYNEHFRVIYTASGESADKVISAPTRRLRPSFWARARTVTRRENFVGLSNAPKNSCVRNISAMSLCPSSDPKSVISSTKMCSPNSMNCAVENKLT